MRLKILEAGLISFLIVISCSCSQGGSRFDDIRPVSEISADRLDNNWLPLDATAVCDTSADGGITLQYKFYSKDCLCTSNPLLVIVNPESWEVTMNGGKPLPMNRVHLLDDGDACFELGGMVLGGENIISLRCSTAPSERPSAYIAGGFDVLPDEECTWLLAPAKVLGLGSWASQGLPFYRSDIAYRCTFELPAKVGRRTLHLGEWKGSLCEVWINGEKAGDIPAKHHRLRIGSFLNPGLNEVELHVTGDGLYEAFTIE